MTAPTPPSEEQFAANRAFMLEALGAYQRWMSRSNWILWPIVIAVMVLTMVAMSTVTQSGGLGIFVSLAMGFVAMFAAMTYVVPRVNLPSLRCPWCSARVPLIETPRPFQRYQITRVCPTCKRDLPVP